jgi:hypothetical protein
MVYESISDLDFNLADVLTQTSIMDNDFSLPHRGFFGDSITEIQTSINRSDLKTLSSIRGVFNDGRYVSDNGENYLYFLPLEKVKEKAQYRKFKSVKEMEDYLEISLGDAICLRSINSKDMPYKVMYVGCGLNSDNNDRIILGHAMYDFEELFEKYEVCKEDEDVWCPFGMLDKPTYSELVPNDFVKSIHLYSVESGDIPNLVGETGYFFDIDDRNAIAEKIKTDDMSNANYGKFSGVSLASMLYPLLCEDSEGYESNWKFFVPEKYLVK